MFGIYKELRSYLAGMGVFTDFYHILVYWIMGRFMNDNRYSFRFNTLTIDNMRIRR